MIIAIKWLTTIGLMLSVSIAGAVGETKKVRFGTNWVPQAEHGGYYQALAEGTYSACGLDVEIIPGGPGIKNREQLVAGNIDFYMGGNLLQAFEAVSQDTPIKVVAAHFQKDPQILMSHPGAVSTFEALKDLEILLSVVNQ